ncbi:MAG: hypothetical protein K9G67_02840 [Bacteroidales bacterium]|nr:hypothetical protein [Bacteroidales bacterium]MCF8351846.1 hypothetical protein [Bacteroidales bacterium]MCF8375265.1 hypothetical protein [Bacteroidales bacterium]MCF8401261.1 hypothetical protein [Bacteroidales bacterium]
MGYMGFGIQRWIYTMRPRKPFSGRRQRGTGMDQDTPARNMNISGTAIRIPQRLRENINQRMNEMGRKWLLDRIFTMAYAAILIGVVVYVLVRFVF